MHNSMLVCRTSLVVGSAVTLFEFQSYGFLNNTYRYSKLISHPPVGQYSKLAPFRILSFDIECAGRKGHFPEPEQDPVIQIANLVTVQGEQKPMVRNVMTLKSCSPIVGASVMSFDSEREVLLAWRDLVREVDPDVIIGYNICKFDLPYLIERAETLKVNEFPILGRIRNSRLRIRDTSFSSRCRLILCSYITIVRCLSAVVPSA
jgi:DNA polymerase delta subunit 1